MDVRLLGTGGWLPTDRRETACTYIRSGPDVLLLDVGTGARRLVTEPSLLEGVERLHVVLSHFHLDHVAGLAALSGLDVEQKEIWMPARLLVDVPAAELLERFVGPPFMTGTDGIGVARELDRDSQVGPFAIELRVQPQHPGRSVAIKVNGSLAYCTDTAYDPENVAFASGATILLHESYWPGASTEDTGHTASGEAAQLAADAGVARLVLVHINPEADDEQELLGPARLHFAATEVGRDGVSLT